MVGMPQNPYEAPSRRRWFRFSLRTVLVAVVVISIPLAWVAYSLKWIRTRHVALRDATLVSYSPDVRAPSNLALFGERGVYLIELPHEKPVDCHELRRLFPEAVLYNRFSPEWYWSPGERVYMLERPCTQ